MNATNVAEIKTMVLGKNTNLRKQPRGYSGLDGARNLLNDMIFESLSKYDAEIAKCTEYYAEQCAAMEVCRGQIAASNYIAANSRALILDSQATINKCEVDIPTRKLELQQHMLKCKHELHKLNTRLKIVMGDISIMTMILEMTDCEKKSYVEFHDADLQQKVNQLKASSSHDLLQSSLADLVFDTEGADSSQLLQIDAHQSPIINKTKFNNPPVPK